MSSETTIQYRILTKTMAIGHSVNPFYGASIDFVKENLQEASECYQKIIQEFKGTWCIYNAKEKGIIKRTDLDHVLENKDKIMDAIIDHTIPALPKELNNFEVSHE